MALAITPIHLTRAEEAVETAKETTSITDQAVALYKTAGTDPHEGAALNVRINADSLEDRCLAEKLIKQAEEIEATLK